MFIKICGISDPDTARFAVAAGANAIGVVMSPKSPRHTPPETARQVVQAVSDAADTVLVVREMPVESAIEMVKSVGFSVLQLHGKYSPAEIALAADRLPRVWRATSLEREPLLHAGEFGEELVLLDGEHAGSGTAWDFSLATSAQLGERWILAGGLTPDNVASAITITHPWGVDVSSGIESAPGVKDQDLISRFIAEAGKN